MTQLNGRVDGLSVLEAEVAQANLSLYVQLTPMDEIRWDQVGAAWDRLERVRAERRGLRPVMDEAAA